MSYGDDPDRTALRRAYEIHHLRLLRLALLLSSNHGRAEDLVQDVFVRAAARLDSLDDSEVYPYLHRSVVNAWKNDIRRQRVAQKAEAPGPRPVSDPDEEHDLWTAITKLPARQRACVVLRYYEDLDDAEIADLLGCRVGTVRSQTSRAIAKLRKVVDG